MHKTSNWLTASAILLVPSVLGACAQTDSQPEAQGPGERVESQALDLAINELPAAFEVETNDASGLILAVPGSAGPARATFELGHITVGGINLVAEAKASKEAFEAQPQGQFFGNQELVTPFGSVFTSRGSYLEDEEAVEELQAYALHPTSNRLLKISMHYPPSESGERAQQFLGLIGEIGPLVSSGSE